MIEIPEPRLVDGNLKTVLRETQAGRPCEIAPDLAKLGRKATELFQLASPYAPGLFYVGALLRLDHLLPAGGQRTGAFSAGGSGLTLASAISSCLGEAAEYASQFAEPRGETTRIDQRILTATLEASGNARALALWHTPPDTGGVDAMPAFEWTQGTPLSLPVDLFLRRSQTQVQPAWPMGAGVAAGSSAAEARERAILELIERDAAARWWCFGAPARRLSPSALDAAFQTVLEQLGRDADLRRFWLLDLASALPVPVVAALACDRDGRSLSVGLAARRRVSDAARAALLELCQMELSLALIRGKAGRRGIEALSPFEVRHYTRGERLNVNAYENLLPPIGYTPHDVAHADPPEAAEPLADVLKLRDIRVYITELTCPEIGAPVVAARSADLLALHNDNPEAYRSLAEDGPAPLSQLSCDGFMLL